MGKQIVAYAIVFCMTLLLLSGVTMAADIGGRTEDGFVYEIDGKSAVLTDYRGTAKQVEVPSSITTDDKKKYAISTIGDNCFYGNADITSVSISDGISVIGNRAFEGCTALKSIDIPDSVSTLGKWAFAGCTSLDDVVIPEKVILIPVFAFQNCESLESIDIPNTVKTIQSEAFFGCTGLTTVEISYGTDTIEDKAFGYYSDSSGDTVKSSSLKLIGYVGTAAENYANKNSFAFSKSDKPVTENFVVYRLYNANNGEHFFTGNSGEKDILVSLGWAYEGSAWTAPVCSNTPVYRVYNPNSGEHHYTINAAEKDILVSIGWNDEGIGWYSDESQGTPLYRLYNPNATGQYEAGAHHHTKDIEERDYLVSLGWNDEDIGWFGR